jgi:regulator of nucleoside diphosphate kinase
MSKTETARASRKPRIHICDSDYDRIANLALAMRRGAPEFAEQMLGEIDRARLHPDGELPAGVVRIGSEVEFRDESSGAARRIMLVLPPEADIEAGRVSVMTSVGAGLIGMSEGQEISWPCPDGRSRTLRILSVSAPAEGGGEPLAPDRDH